jgi:hypothetical protein
LSASDYLRLAEECLLLATLAKDPDKAAELVKTGDDYLRRAAKGLAHRIKDHWGSHACPLPSRKPLAPLTTLDEMSTAKNSECLVVC